MTSIAYNQGIAFDPSSRDFFFTGVSSLTTSGLYRTNSNLDETAANIAVLPATREGYNHAGDLSFDSVTRRVLLPLECYYPPAEATPAASARSASPIPPTCACSTAST
jgi:hypothetical protein